MLESSCQGCSLALVFAEGTEPSLDQDQLGVDCFEGGVHAPDAGQPVAIIALRLHPELLLLVRRGSRLGTLQQGLILPAQK